MEGKLLLAQYKPFPLHILAISEMDIAELWVSNGRYRDLLLQDKTLPSSCIIQFRHSEMPLAPLHTHSVIKPLHWLLQWIMTLATYNILVGREEGFVLEHKNFNVYYCLYLTLATENSSRSISLKQDMYGGNRSITRICEREAKSRKFETMLFLLSYSSSITALAALLSSSQFGSRYDP